MKKVFRHSVVISDNTGIIKDKHEFTVTEHEVLGENEEFIVLNDRRFTTVSKTNRQYETSLDKHYVSLYAGDNVYGNRIEYLRFSESKCKPATIRKEIEKAIEKKFGYFVKWADLSVVA